jgi:hypothetical protein
MRLRRCRSRDAQCCAQSSGSRVTARQPPLHAFNNPTLYIISGSNRLITNTCSTCGLLPHASWCPHNQLPGLRTDWLIKGPRVRPRSLRAIRVPRESRRSTGRQVDSEDGSLDSTKLAKNGNKIKEDDYDFQFATSSSANDISSKNMGRTPSDLPNHTGFFQTPLTSHYLLKHCQ